jgi:hypothetical protein
VVGTQCCISESQQVASGQGVRTLEVKPGCILTVVPSAMDVPDSCVRCAWALMGGVPPTPNPLNPKQCLRRRQLAFGSAYSFGQQRVKAGAVVPDLVKLCIAHSCEAAPSFGADPAWYTGAHVNWYDGGAAGIGRHQDYGEDGAPIFSYTFLVDPCEGKRALRTFRVFDSRAAADPLVCVPLEHGMLVVMHGPNFQDPRLGAWHDVPPAPGKAFRESRRINVTVRGWRGAAAVRGDVASADAASADAAGVPVKVKGGARAQGAAQQVGAAQKMARR